MEIQVEHRTAATVVRITGDVEGTTAEHLLNELQARVGEGHVRLVGDLSGVSYTSSAGLRALLAAVRAARSGGGDLRLAAVHPPVRKVLELSGFTTILKLYDDVDGAVASYSA
ncbi:MAG TPA: STAS domain-containing protein [Ramlibacter sp.]|nr:STAS domain-containing protein [Ramlibacter sp.]